MTDYSFGNSRKPVSNLKEAAEVIKKLYQGVRKPMTEPEKKHNQAIVEIPFDLLADILDFPLGTTIHRVQQTFDVCGNNKIQIVVDHPDLPAFEEGDIIPRVLPEYTAEKVGGIFRPEFKNWGIKYKTIADAILNTPVDTAVLDVALARTHAMPPILGKQIVDHKSESGDA